MRLSQAVGAALAVKRVLLLASHGADVAISSRTASECEEVAAYIHKTYGTKTLVVTGDVSNEADVQQIIQSVEKELGKVSVLINNAGIMSFITIYGNIP